MNDLNTHHDHAPACILAGALAHLAQHMENGCPRSAYLAAMLLEQIALDLKVDSHLRQHAQQLVEILGRAPNHSATNDIAPESTPRLEGRQSTTRRCAQ